MEKHVAIIHPDLGIGGAEQLVVNLALGLQMTGHKVTIFTPRHDRTRCFKETRDGTIPVEVRGSVFPAKVMGKGTAFCSLVRMLLASLYVVFFAGHFDYVIVDQVSAVLPIFWFSSSKVIFYCHYPDQLLCTERESALKRIYRFFLDKIEELGILKADLIYVNSNFTKKITQSTFKSLSTRELKVLYPCINLNFPEVSKSPAFLSNSSFFFSLNRYERKKNIGLAVEAYSQMQEKSVKLLIGGGYDPDLAENREHLIELFQLCTKFGLSFTEVNDWEKPLPGYQVYFVKNLNDRQKEEALQNALAVLYTPENGIG
jgi:alpha-1,3/alpha-1,6-mannosyltransferase